MANLEVISAENFQRRLEGIHSSCLDCLRQRAREAHSDSHQTHKRRKTSRIRLNSPIVVRLQDTIKVSVKNRLKRSPKSSDVDSDQSSDDGFPCKKETVSLNNIIHNKSWKSLRGDKNFNAFLSAIERVHLKDHGSLSANLENLEEFVRSTKEKHRIGGFLNNSINNLGSISDKDQAAIRRSLEFLEKDNVDLICNDLSSKSSAIDSEECGEDSEQSENSSIISSTEESQSESDISSDSQGEDLSTEELERLTEFTTGYPLTRYDCPPHECPECLTAYYAYTSSYYPECPSHADYSSNDSDDTASDISELEDRRSRTEAKYAVRVLQKGKVEVSVGALHHHSKRQKQQHQQQHHRYNNRRPSRPNYEHLNSVYVDLSDTDVAFSVQYHQLSENSDGSAVGAMSLPDWFMYPYGIMGYMPVSLPYYLMPIYYLPYPLLTMPKPICVPRNTRCLSSSKLCMVPAHEVKSCKFYDYFVYCIN